MRHTSQPTNSAQKCTATRRCLFTPKSSPNRRSHTECTRPTIASSPSTRHQANADDHNNVATLCGTHTYIKLLNQSDVDKTPVKQGEIIAVSTHADKRCDITTETAKTAITRQHTESRTRGVDGEEYMERTRK